MPLKTTGKPGTRHSRNKQQNKNVILSLSFFGRLRMTEKQRVASPFDMLRMTRKWISRMPRSDKCVEIFL